MSRKIKKVEESVTSTENYDDNEESPFEIFLDAETNEVVIMNIYRKKWGDEIDYESEQVFTYEEAKDLLNALVKLVDEMEYQAKKRVE